MPGVHALARRLLLLATALLLVPLAAPAGAEVVRDRDATGDATGRYQADLRAVRVDHRARGVVVDVRGDIADLYQVYVDTDAADPGPEYLVSFTAETESPVVNEVDVFSRAKIVGTRPQDVGAETCRAPQVRASFVPGGRTFHVEVPRSCLGDPARVRVAVQVAMDFPGTTTDWSPRRRHFGSWAATS